MMNLSFENAFMKKVKQKQQKYLECWTEIFMKMHYANEVDSLSVHLPSQYAYPNERNFTVNRLHKRKKLFEQSVAKSNCNAS